jgi:EAL domain-containing protein (putative c-di-GMP-specific phosphodiesterase class I)
MRDTLLSEQKIVTEMSSALKSGQFEVWFQPQYNHLTEELIGAEALVRWRHPEQGLIPPDRFIPIFEKNGFVYEMDKYVWEHTCMFLHTWIKEKRNPLPISVNISRYDIFQDDMVQILLDLLEKYEIPVALLRLEITESAFAQSSRRVVAVAKELVKHGFTVEIDDFGSGYSSLNTLKDVPAQIIKLDMKFFSASDDYQRGGSIVESMVRMAKWLNMAVIAEGVETVKQADFLKTIGCYYIQGYLYAKPMPVEDYVKLASQGSKQPHLQHVETVANLDSNAFWDPNSMDTLIFNSYIGGACIMEYCRGRIELLRANDKYLEMIGGTGMTLDDLLKLDWAKYMSVESSRHMDRIVANAMQADSEETGEFIFIDLPGCAHKTYLRSTLRVIARTGYRYLLYCTSENITAQRNAEQKQSETMDQLRFLENVAHNLLTQQDPEAGIEAILDQMLGFFESSRICIYEFDFVHRYAINTYEQHTDSVQDLPASLAKITMHSPDKWKKTFAGHHLIDISDLDHAENIGPEQKLLKDHGIHSLLAVALKQDGHLIGVAAIEEPHRKREQINSLSALGDYISVLISRRNTNAEILNENQEKLAVMNGIPGGFIRMQIKEDGTAIPLYHSEGFLKLVNMSAEHVDAIYRTNAMNGVHPEDVGIVQNALNILEAGGEVQNVTYRLQYGGGGYIHVSIFGKSRRGKNGEIFLNIYYANAEDRPADRR